jgi:peptide deformylase
MSLSIVHYPHPTLRHCSSPLKRVDAQLKRWVAEMFALMYEHQGVGLAANQVDLPYRVFVANPTGDPQEKDAELVFLNPVLSRGKGSAEAEEGCLSIPNVVAPVSRNMSIRVSAFDLSGNEFTADLKDFLARIVQHETDHLDGRLFIDKLSTTQRAELRDQLEEFELGWRSRCRSGEVPSPDEIAQRLVHLEEART